jgi:hypothetical protein
MSTPQVTIQIAGLDTALRALAAVQGGDMAQAIGVAVAELAVIPAARPYPGRSGRRMAIKSSAQRRLIFAKIKAGAIPYSRTYRLMQGWRFRGVKDGAMVENAVPYAGLVVGEAQAPYHAGTWRTVVEVAAEVESGAAAHVGEAAAALFIVRQGLG